MYQTILRCPVCNTIMDEIRHPYKEPNSYGLALLGGDGRRYHAKISPLCIKDEKWIRGWKQEDSIELIDFEKE